MFTGIIEEVGTVRQIESSGIFGKIAVSARAVLDGTRTGDSIAVNGVCLTVTSVTGGGFTADVMAETLRRSSLSRLKSGSPVNLERALRADGRFGGHIVSGHIDGTGTIEEFRPEGPAVWVRISAPEAILALVVEKGSVAVDGISLTVAAAGQRDFQVSLIPHTGLNTSLLSKKAGEPVNLETDVIGKYVRKLLSDRLTDTGGREPVTGGAGRSGITEEFLRENGF